MNICLGYKKIFTTLSWSCWALCMPYGKVSADDQAEEASSLSGLLTLHSTTRQPLGKKARIRRLSKLPHKRGYVESRKNKQRYMLYALNGMGFMVLTLGYSAPKAEEPNTDADQFGYKTPVIKEGYYNYSYGPYDYTLLKGTTETINGAFGETPIPFIVYMNTMKERVQTRQVVKIINDAIQEARIFKKPHNKGFELDDLRICFCCLDYDPQRNGPIVFVCQKQNGLIKPHPICRKCLKQLHSFQMMQSVKGKCPMCKALYPAHVKNLLDCDEL